MSHRFDCPDPREARREGERAYDRGYGSNPYSHRDWSESFDDRHCREDAESEWWRGYYAAEARAEEEAAERRSATRRAAERRDEEAYYESQQAEADYYNAADALHSEQE